VYGYSLAFGGALSAPDASESEKTVNNYSPFLGNTDILFMNNVQRRLKVEKTRSNPTRRRGCIFCYARQPPGRKYPHRLG